LNPDFRDLLSTFNAQGVEYLVVGAHALAAHGHVRATKDLDIWVRPHPANAPRVIDALRAFGAPLLDLSEKDLTQPGMVFQIGVPPVRIDVITAIDGVAFEDAWSDRMPTTYGDVPTSVLSFNHLVINKEASGRPQDLADLDWLRSQGLLWRRP
jgi:hypothetical protein